MTSSVHRTCVTPYYIPLPQPHITPLTTTPHYNPSLQPLPQPLTTTPHYTHHHNPSLHPSLQADILTPTSRATPLWPHPPPHRDCFLPLTLCLPVDGIRWRAIQVMIAPLDAPSHPPADPFTPSHSRSHLSMHPFTSSLHPLTLYHHQQPNTHTSTPTPQYTHLNTHTSPTPQYPLLDTHPHLNTRTITHTHLNTHLHLDACSRVSRRKGHRGAHEERMGLRLRSLRDGLRTHHSRSKAANREGESTTRYTLR